MLNPCELEIDLLCKGIRIAESATLEADGRLIHRTRAGLGSGLELILPGPIKDIWVNVPVEEDFAQISPYLLTKNDGDYEIMDQRQSRWRYRARIPPEPPWYRRKTSKGVEMNRVGVLQGSYLAVYLSNSCMYWYQKGEPLNCRFCTTGYNVGMNEVVDKDIEDVVETAQAAKRESGVTFVHFNSGYHHGRDLDIAAPYVKAIKERVGALVGVQVIPGEHWKYDWLIDLGTDHFSFCYEFHNPEYFARLLPGKHATVGQERFFRAMEYAAGKMPKGAVSGEIIAGVEPIEDTLAAIDYITGIGAFPTVCIFRPTIGGDMEDHPSPDYEDMRRVMEYMYRACRRNGIPIGAAPNIEVSLICQPDDAKLLAPRDRAWRAYDLKCRLIRLIARPKFAWEMRRRKIRASAEHPSPRRTEPAKEELQRR